MLAVGLLLIGASHSYDGRNVWRDWTEAKELRRPAYAERIYPDDLLRTRANSWSNLTYVLVGFYAIALGCHDLRRKRSAEDGYLIHTPPMSILFGVTCCYLGFGSGLFHASLTRWGQQLDVAAMYAPLLACIAINLGTLDSVRENSWSFGWLSNLADADRLGSGHQLPALPIQMVHEFRGGFADAHPDRGRLRLAGPIPSTTPVGCSLAGLVHTGFGGSTHLLAIGRGGKVQRPHAGCKVTPSGICSPAFPWPACICSTVPR